jgi:uncharacterized protein (DUF2342 family)
MRYGELPMSQMDKAETRVVDPPDPARLNDPKHWRDRAEEARTVAEPMKDLRAREIMLGVAATYEKLAQSAEEKVKPA